MSAKNIEREIAGLAVLATLLLGVLIGLTIGRQNTESGMPINIRAKTFKEGEIYNLVPNLSAGYLLISTPNGQKIFFAKDTELADWIKENKDFVRQGKNLIPDSWLKENPDADGTIFTLEDEN